MIHKVKNMNFKDKDLFLFIALMGTSALNLSLNYFKNNIIYWLNQILLLMIFLLFSFNFIKFLFHLIENKRFRENIKNPSVSNLYGSVAISSALISIIFSSIHFKLFLNNQTTFYLSLVFWLIALISGILFVVIIPLNLKFRSKIENVNGSWFLPPVGLFVIITAGNFLALRFNYHFDFIEILNLMLIGPAFILYFLTLNLVYFRSKFYDIHNKITPSFNIVLAPIGVSILAMISLNKLIIKNDIFKISNLFLGITKLYGLILFGYGLWVLFGLLILYFRVIKEKKGIDFSLLWWAFVFPLGAFTLATLNLFNLFKLKFFMYLFYVLFSSLVIVWFMVLIKQILMKRTQN